MYPLDKVLSTQYRGPRVPIPAVGASVFLSHLLVMIVHSLCLYTHFCKKLVYKNSLMKSLRSEPVGGPHQSAPQQRAQSHWGAPPQAPQPCPGQKGNQWSLAHERWSSQTKQGKIPAVALVRAFTRHFYSWEVTHSLEVWKKIIPNFRAVREGHFPPLLFDCTIFVSGSWCSTSFCLFLGRGRLDHL